MKFAVLTGDREKMGEVLKIQNLKMHFPVKAGIFRRITHHLKAVDGVSLSIEQGKTLGLVGESGSGKTSLGRSVMRLIEPTEGEILFYNQDLRTMPKKNLRHLRQNIQMIFQDPYESLNPRHTIQRILKEPFIVHRKSYTIDDIKYLIERVGLPADSLDRYPHEFSGGQRQRIGIARAIALNPKLIVCDEPVSALDVSVQSQILNLLLDLQREMNVSYLFIAHNLAVVKHMSDDIAVMYLGKIVEYTSSSELYKQPLHPYTKALMASKEKIFLKGEISSSINLPKGCRFQSRCPYVMERCCNEEPGLKSKNADDHLVACHY